MRPVYAQILDACEAAGITALFGIPDPGFFHLFNAAEARGWTVLAPHHEAAGGFMAEGWARLTGRPALCVGSLGPGIANAAPAMIHAMAERSPVLFLGGRRAGLADAPTRRGRFQHGEQRALYAPAVVYAGAIEAAEQAGAVLDQALAALANGPAYVEIPGDVMLAASAAPVLAAPPAPPLPDVAQAAALMAAARAPMILAGHGVHTARAGGLLADLARRIGCPVVQTPGGAAAVEGLASFPYGFSPVARAIIAQSDLVVAIGTEIGEQVHFGQRRHWKTGDAERRWIHIERDAASIGANRPIDAPLPGDLRAILPVLTAACAPRGADPALPGWSAAEAEHRAAQAAAARAYPDTPVHPARLVVEATAALPADAILIRDGGASVLFQFAYAQQAPRDVLWSQNYGHLGTGLPMAVGAMLGAPDRPALLLTGDSAMLFHVAELETTARAGLPLVCVVAVDRQWGLEVGMTRRLVGADTPETGTHWGAVRFDVLARGFGCDGAFVESGADLAPMLAQGFATARANRRPFVLHVAVDPRANAEDMPGLSEFASWFQP